MNARTRGHWLQGIAFVTALAVAQTAAADARAVAIAPLAGDHQATHDELGRQLTAAGHTVTWLSAADAKQLESCGPRPSETCLSEAATRLRASGARFDVLVTGTVHYGVPDGVHLVAFDASTSATLEAITTSYLSGDEVAPVVVPQRLVAAIGGEVTSPELSPREAEVMASLDEPPKSPEQLARETEQLALAEREATARAREELEYELHVPVHLRTDFREVCETGPRRGGERDTPRPRCERGPFFGYWRPTSWVALGVASGALVATGVFYGLAAATRTQYRDALAADDEARIAETGAQMRQRALLGDVALATTGLVAGIMVISVVVDRFEAKRMVRSRKIERMLARFPIAVTAGRHGAGAQLRGSF
ncbi:MAG: hypothetical protein IAG13_31440 [Deltaproteobacteria bacterium]|nr:hypothetical protein [Nannocystaceae bacterium]